ncbi:MAG: DMT family transporter [Cyanobacteria bacterium P01_G01_bin.54]
MQGLSRQQWQKFSVAIVLGVGVLGVATSAVMIRLAIAAAQISGVGFSLFLAAARMVIAALVLAPSWRNFSPRQVSRRAIWTAIAAGLCLALHVAAWISSLSFTSIAASTTLVTTNPIWVALICWFWYGDRPRRLTQWGIAIALAGSSAIVLGGSAPLLAGSQPLLGNSLALFGAWLASAYMLLGRAAQRQGLSLGHYSAIAYSTAAVLLLPLPGLWGIPYGGYTGAVYGAIAGMAILGQLVGHTSINWSLTQLSPTLVALCLLFEPVGASLLGAIVFGELPTLNIWLGAAIVLAGVALATLGERKV